MDTIQYIKDVIVAVKHELIRRRAAVSVVFSLVFVAVLVVAINWPKNYVSEARIVVNVTNVIEPLLRGRAELTSENRSETVQDVMMSRRILERVVERVHPNFEQLSPELLELEVRRLRGSLEVASHGRNSNVTIVRFYSGSPDLAYDNLSALVDIFIADRAAQKQAQSFAAYNFISNQVERYKDRLERAEMRLKEFRARTVNATEQTVARRISDLNAEIQSLHMAISESEEKIRTTQAHLSMEGRNRELRSQLQGLLARREVISDRLEQLRMTYQESYPDVVAVRRQLDEIDFTIAQLRDGAEIDGTEFTSDQPLYEELRKQLSAAQVDLRTQRRRLVALNELLEEEHKMADQVAANQAELTDLTRDYNVTKNAYEEMLVRQENAKLTMALNDEGQGETYKVAEPPFYPISPAGIPAMLVFLAAPLLALGAPIGLATLYVLVDPRVRSVALLAQKLPEGVGLLGAVPHKASPLATRLMRIDIVLLGLLFMLLAGLYVYVFQVYGGSF